MDRRLVGAMVLTAAVLLVLVGPGLGGRLVAGQASGVRIPAQPTVGSCVPAGALGAPDPLRVVIEVDSMAIRECPGVRAAEIVMVTSVPVGSDFPVYELTANTQQESCMSAAQWYVGLRPPQVDPIAIDPSNGPQSSGAPPSTTVSGSPSASGPSTAATPQPADHVQIADPAPIPEQAERYVPLMWTPAVSMGVSWLAPTESERASGGSWLACAVMPLVPGSYDGTAQGAFSGGALPEAFGVCWAGTDLDALPAMTSCQQPHGSQLVATTTLADRNAVPFDQIVQSCATVAARLIGRPDPIIDGALRTVTDPADLPSKGRGEMTVMCFVTATGSRELNSTVLGLGDRPIPYVG